MKLKKGLPKFTQATKPKATVGLTGTGSTIRRTLAGVPVDEHTVLGIAAYRKGVELIANTVAGLDLYPAERNARGGFVPALDSWAYDLVRSKPNDEITSFSFRQAIMGHALMFGNGYAEIDWGQGGDRALGFHLLEPTTTKTARDEAGNLVYLVDNGDYILPAPNVLHFHGFSRDGISGHSTIKTAAEMLGVALSQLLWESSVFGNSANPSGFIKLTGSSSPEAREEMRNRWNSMHQGVGRNHNVAVLFDGAEFVGTGFTPADAQLTEARQFSIGDIARLLNLPGWMLDAQGSSKPATSEDQMREFFTLTILPILKMAEAELDSKLLLPQERKTRFFHHDFSPLLRGDIKSQILLEESLFRTGAMSINERRLNNGLDPRDGENFEKSYIGTNNLTAVEDIVPGVATQPLVSRPLPPAPDLPNDEEDALRSILLDPLTRLAKVEANAVRRAAKGERFDLWAESYYPKHTPKLTDAITPAVSFINSMSGRSLDPTTIAQAVGATALEELRSLWTCIPPDELPEAIERVLSKWVAERANEVVNQWLL